jgi:hypothetical protein
MKTIKIAKDEILTPFITPPENGGQIVEVSYGGTESMILRRTYDASDRSDKIEAFLPKSGEESFEPWNGTPKLGRRVGRVEVLS